MSDEFRACQGDPCTLKHDHELHRHDAPWKERWRLEQPTHQLERRVTALERQVDDLRRLVLEREEGR